MLFVLFTLCCWLGWRQAFTAPLHSGSFWVFSALNCAGGKDLMESRADASFLALLGLYHPEEGEEAKPGTRQATRRNPHVGVLGGSPFSCRSLSCRQHPPICVLQIRGISPFLVFTTLKMSTRGVGIFQQGRGCRGSVKSNLCCNPA